MSAASQDTSQWLSVTEETLFMHDGIVRVSDLVELPIDMGTATGEEDQELVSFDSKSPEELCDRLLAVCGNQNNSYTRLLEYRLSALKGLWKAQLQIAHDEDTDRETSTREETIQMLKKQGIWKEPDPASFSTRVSLLLVLPLIQSQSKYDPTLGGITAELLLSCLRDCAPLSLSKEPVDCLNGLERLLCNWLEGDGAQIPPVSETVQRQNAASTLVALACARGHLKTFIHTVHLLQRLDNLGSLPVADILQKLLQTEGGQGQPTSVLGNKHLMCWGIEDLLTPQEREEKPESGADNKVVEPELGRGLATDGMYLYVTGKNGGGIAKIGSGLYGTLRGYVYAKNSLLSPGHVAYGSGLLIHRPSAWDTDNAHTDSLVQILNTHTLTAEKLIRRPADYAPTASPCTTVGVCGDGIHFYWLWCAGSLGDKTSARTAHSVYLDTFSIQASDLQAMPVSPGVCIQKKEEPSSKTLNEALLSRLRPYRSSATAATLVALTGGESPMAKKDEVSGITSCGVLLKNLVKTPLYCDGTTLVLLTPLPGSGGGGGTGRFSFGGTSSGLTGLRAVASNLCFNVSDGQFNTRTDLVDAPTCALTRGAPIHGMGMAYDWKNNMIWTCTQDWVDQFYNPAHQATHHIHHRLGIDQGHGTTLSKQGYKDVRLSPEEVISTLLVHIGSMCIHQLNNDLLNTPLGTYILQQQPADLTYMGRVCDVLQRAIEGKQETTIITGLIIMQLLLRMSVFGRDRDRELELISRSSGLLWQVMSAYNTVEEGDREASCIQTEVCGAMLAGLDVIYTRPTDQYNLLSKLLSEGEKQTALARLRDLMLLQYADRLRDQVIDAHKVRHARLTSDLTQYIIKMTVKESCTLLHQCQTVDREGMDKILAQVPLASPSLQYLMALQTHLLRTSVVYRVTPARGVGEGGAEAAAGEGKNTTTEGLGELQDALLGYTTKVLEGTYQVLEVLLETCNTIINTKSEDLDYWLQGVERVAKASLLGHLIPLLVTGMTHHNLRCLSIADSIMSQLAQLIVLTSQAALLLKSRVQILGGADSDPPDLSPDVDIARIIGDTVSIDSFDTPAREENGFLAGLKIPAPWTTGKSLETIHPVRDNYKFKETVHIPGARCLFLRFDPRCSSQYDYDKLVVYAGPNTSCKKSCEYGGNTLGYGSRSVLGSGWPKDLVRVDGDTVTFSFEMRSGREHNTPDKAMWGFSVTVRAQENTDEVSSGLAFLADLALGLSVLGCTMLHLLYQGPEQTPDEDKCQHLLKAKLLQRCVWQSDGNDTLFGRSALSSLWDTQQQAAATATPEDKSQQAETSNQPAAAEAADGKNKLTDSSKHHPLADAAQNSATKPAVSSGDKPPVSVTPPPLATPPPPASPGGKRGTGGSLPRVRMPSEIVRKLREMSQFQPPQIRPSMRVSQIKHTPPPKWCILAVVSRREVIRPEILEENIVSTTLKHLSLVDTVRHLVSHEQHHTEEYRLLQDVMQEVYRKIHALIRQLQCIAELEQKWCNEVDDVRQGTLTNNEVFFIDYHLIEDKGKDLAILCFFKDIPMDMNDLESAVSDLRERLDSEVAIEPRPADPPLPKSRAVVTGLLERLTHSLMTSKIERLDSEVAIEPRPADPPLPKSRAVVTGLLERLTLLLHVTILPEGGDRPFSRSASLLHHRHIASSMVRSDTDVLKAPSYSRSFSLGDRQRSVDDSILDIVRLQKRRHKKGPASILQDLVDDDLVDKPPHITLVDQLFTFIGSSPEKAVSCESFLSAAKTRWRRGKTRQQALVHMRELLLAASRVGGATHLVAAVTSVLQHGPRIEELTCGGVGQYVREAFAETMTSVVQLAARYPIACCNSIGLLCSIPYTRSEERCLVRSGLVHLLDRLCSLTNYRGAGERASGGPAGGKERQSARQRVSLMAWAGFQVLSNRCVSWEQDDGVVSDELEHSGLACQVSTLLTNHLARATECSGNEAAGNEALQEVLSLLNGLSRSKMGQAILSQPGCVSKLMSLLLDQRPSPKLVLIILQLCRVALPLMSSDDCERVDLPTWGQHVHSAIKHEGHRSVSPMDQSPETESKPYLIASLLLAKLGDYLTPGSHTTVSSRRPSLAGLESTSATSTGSEKDKSGEDSDIQDGRLTVFVHKREDQSSHEVIQPLLSADSRPFRLSGGSGNMEKVVRMDREMTKYGAAEVVTEEVVSALRKAAKWAGMGLVVSTGPPVDLSAPDPGTGGDKKKMAGDVVCKDKNIELARTDPVRPFISGHVANSMATEVIALLHSLLNAREVLTAQTWVSAVEKVISRTLTCLPLLLSSVEDMASPRCNKEELITMAKQVNAALSALGGFEEMVKPGSTVEIIGEGIENSPARVVSISEAVGLATVTLLPPTGEGYEPARYSDTVQVPMARLRPPSDEPLPLLQLSMTESIVSAVQSLLLPHSGSASPLAQQLPIYGLDAQILANQLCRVLAEIRSRACKVLALHLKDISFAGAFIQHSSASIDILKLLAKECGEGERLPCIEGLCHRMRMLYRDCAKPPPPPAKLPTRTAKEITWDVRRSFPPIRACLFSHGNTGITFLGDPSAGSGLPRGTIVYSTHAIPTQAPSFYWEIEVCAFGDPAEESGPFISFGFMAAAERKEGGWTQPVGSILFHNNGRAVHYNGASLLQWRSLRLDITLALGDVIGIGWERQEGAGADTCKGRVYFTYNGRRLQPVMEDVNGGMWPVVHLQKKSTRVRANFGGRQFAYAEGQEHRDAADECHTLIQENKEMFGLLPFACLSDSSDSDSGSMHSASSSPSADAVRTPPGPPCRTPHIPRSLKEYNTESCVTYKLMSCYENFLHTGPDTRTQQANQDLSGSDVEDTGDEEEPAEDHYALLVKAWEQKVFPVIRRRFRNEAERKDGLEQIKGALQLGMVDIARQTVEFLYEENGGMPRDLHLPTIDDIRDELAKFTIERVRKGTTVVIRPLQASGTAGTTLLPKYAVRGMMKTYGLTGCVLDVDQPGQLVQVETYLLSEGVLVRYWYPLEVLERPPQGYRKSSLVGQQLLDTSSLHIHRELLKKESYLAKMYCRTALLELITQCNSPQLELTSCATGLGSAMAASAALLQELDVENLQLLSDELLAAPQPHGSIIASSLVTSASASQCLAPHTCSPSRLFYSPGGGQKLCEELKVAIARAANQGEDYVIELSNQICMCLQTAPEQFPFEEFPVNETKICTDVHFPGAAFLIISCRTDPRAVSKDTSLYKCPWAKIYTYQGHRVKKTGQSTKQEVVCYPRNCTATSSHCDQYSPCIVATDTVHIRVGVSPPPGMTLTIHALPPQFSLSLSYIETLVSNTTNFQYRRSDFDSSDKDRNVDGGYYHHGAVISPSSSKESSGATSPWRTFDSIVITPSVLMHICDLIAGYLWRTDVPAVAKEIVFHCLAQTLRMLRVSESGMSDMIPTCTPQYSPTMSLFKQLQAEMKRLYDEETKSWPSGSTVSGPGIGLGVGDTGRFSTYFQSLLEVCLAVAEVTPLHPTPGSLGGSEGGLDGSAMSLGLPTSPYMLGKRKKLKAKRERGAVSARHSGSPLRRPSESESPLSSSPVMSGGEASSSGTGISVTTSDPSLQSGSKGPEEMLWYHRAITMSQILRYVTSSDTQGHVVTNDAIADAFHCLSNPTSHGRLLVVMGIPRSLDEQTVRTCLIKSCGNSEGLFQEELYLPVETVTSSPPVTSSHTSTNQSSASGSSSATMATASSASLSSSYASASSQSEAIANNDTPSNQSQALNNATSSPAATGLVVADKNGAKLTLPTDDEMNRPVTPHTMIKGYAVIEVRTKSKLDSVKKALYKNKTFLDELSGPGGVTDDITYDMMTVSTVNQGLIAEPHGNEALEEYLLQKLVSAAPAGDTQLLDSAVIAVTDVFHSCFISEQHHAPASDTRHESGYICLGKEQISMLSPGNLMYVFFSAVKPLKKTFGEQVKEVLRRYGVPKVIDKDDSDKKSKPSKKPARPSMKEKMAMGTSHQTKQQASREKVNKPVKKESKDNVREKDREKSGAATPPRLGAAKLHKEVREEDRLLTLDGFLHYVLDKVKQDVRGVWKALFTCGFDLHFERCGCVDTNQAQQMNEQWTPDMDAALVHLVNSLCHGLAISPARLHPHEIYLTQAQVTNATYAPLQGMPVESVRLRFALLQSLNTTLETFFLPMVDLRPTLAGNIGSPDSGTVASAVGGYSASTAGLLSRARGIIFYDTKLVLLNRVINATVKRKPDQAAPEITLDPLQNVGGERKSSQKSNLCQALCQLSTVASSQLCVQLAAGGDPTYSFNVRFTGEEVHGTSGSFRHFLCAVSRELESSALDLLTLCPSAASHKNRGSYMLRPGPMTYAEERLLQFFGQLLGIAIRADIPLGLDLLPVFWKNLVDVELDPVTDLQEADIVTYNYIKKFEMLESEDELRSLYAEQVPRFVYQGLNGDEVQLIPNGRHICVKVSQIKHTPPPKWCILAVVSRSWENRQLYADNIRHLRMTELRCSERVQTLKAGLASILPLQLLPLLSPADAQLRTCGLPEVNLDFLKAHTMYQVGLMENDRHIQYFWNVLEGLSQEDLCRFIKFACNQERIPQTCPCRDGGTDAAHVPPYPMKIAPPDGAGSPDSRHIRVETCMFMIKLPQYSSEQVTRQRLLYAIHCREDPLSG